MELKAIDLNNLNKIITNFGKDVSSASLPSLNSLNILHMRKLYSKKLLTATGFCLALNMQQANAQISDCSIFLLGNKIEAGVNWNGALGASTAPPTGSHANESTSLYNSPRCSGTLYTGISLGVIADPDEDGWTAGVTPFFGDFVLPGGSANEGWSLMYDGVQKNAWNTDAAIHDSIDNMSAYLYSYTDTAGVIEAKTQSSYNGMYVTQWVTLNKSKLYMNVEVLIENTTLAAAGDMYYMRWINPHNDPMTSSVPSPTNNKILYQVPDTGNRVVVTSRGSLYNNAFLALGTKDDRATAFIAKHVQVPNTNTIDYLNFGDTSCLYGVNDSVTANAAMGIIYNIGVLNSGGAAYLNMFYAFRPDVVNDGLYSNHVGIHNVYASGRQLTVFPNPVRKEFSIKGMDANDLLDIYDITGRQVGYERAGNYTFSIDGLTAGTYVGVVKNSEGVVKGRIRLQKL